MTRRGTFLFIGFCFWAGIILCTPSLHAHTVPVMTVETVFMNDGGCHVQINLDPRLFLSEQPTSLPPLEAKWYHDQSPEERAIMEEKATAYLKKALQFHFGAPVSSATSTSAPPTAVPALTFLAIDGATNEALTETAAEVHLLARGKFDHSGPGHEFSLTLSKDANTSLVLLTSQEGQTDPRVQVVFPGETSVRAPKQ